MKKLATAVLALVLFAATHAAASTITYANTSSGQFGTLNLATGAFTSVGNTPTVLSGIAATPTGSVYGLDASNNLVLINPANANTTIVGNAGVSLVVFAGLTNGDLYGLDFNNNLYSINSATGAASLVGATGLPPIPADSGFANGLAGGASTLYLSYQIYNTASHGPFGPSFYSLNPATGAPTLIGPAAQDTTGLGFVDGVLYGPARVGGVFDLVSINQNTGAASVIAPLSGVNGFVYGIAAPQPVPEPTTLCLLGSGLAFAIRRRKRNRGIG